jgi:phosphatidylserine/phosphatidylglycerophosphate/cardiolipin synthase-like enzyme
MLSLIDPIIPLQAGAAANCPDVTVCFTPGENCTDTIVNVLGEAKTSILVQAYSFTLTPIAKALVDAKERGVWVEAILDKSIARINTPRPTFWRTRAFPP